jgi:hypothetical protein
MDKDDNCDLNSHTSYGVSKPSPFQRNNVLPCPTKEDGSLIEDWKCPKVGCSMGQWLKDHECPNVKDPTAERPPCCCSFGAHRWVVDSTRVGSASSKNSGIVTNYPIPASDTTPGISFAFEQRMLEKTTEYDVRVRSKNILSPDYSTWSLFTTMTTPASEVIPATPEPGCLSNDYVQIQMEEPPPIWKQRIDGYEIYVKVGEDGSYTKS